MDNSDIQNDLSEILSRYRMMAYHNLDTGRDEGVVFVEKGKETGNCQLVKWKSEDNSSKNSLSKIECSLVTPIATSSPASRPQVSLSCQSNSSIKNKYIVESLSPISKNPLASELRSKSPAVQTDLKSNSFQLQKSSSDALKNFSLKKSISTSSDLINARSENSSAEKTVKDLVFKVIDDKLLRHKNKEQLMNASEFHKHVSIQKKLEKEFVNVDKSKRKTNGPDFNFNDNQIPSLNEDESTGRLSEKYSNLELSQDDKMSNSVDDDCIPIIENSKYMVSAKCGWTREVMKGDFHLVSNRISVSYIPPYHLRKIKQRILNKEQLVAFLLDNCPNSHLTLSNFSFVPLVLGLGKPWEIIRSAPANFDFSTMQNREVNNSICKKTKAMGDDKRKS